MTQDTWIDVGARILSNLVEYEGPFSSQQNDILQQMFVEFGKGIGKALADKMLDHQHAIDEKLKDICLERGRMHRHCEATTLSEVVPHKCSERTLRRKLRRKRAKHSASYQRECLLQMRSVTELPCQSVLSGASRREDKVTNDEAMDVLEVDRPKFTLDNVNGADELSPACQHDHQLQERVVFLEASLSTLYSILLPAPLAYQEATLYGIPAHVLEQQCAAASTIQRSWRKRIRLIRPAVNSQIERQEHTHLQLYCNSCWEVLELAHAYSFHLCRFCSTLYRQPSRRNAAVVVNASLVDDDNTDTCTDLSPVEAVWCICLNVFPHLSGQTLLDAIYDMRMSFHGAPLGTDYSSSAQRTMLQDLGIDEKKFTAIVECASRCSLHEWETFENSL